MQYEEIVYFLNELPKTGFFDNKIVAQKYDETKKDYKISDELLNKLIYEYKEICQMSKQYKNMVKYSSTPFKYYLFSNKKLFAVIFPKDIN